MNQICINLSGQSVKVRNSAGAIIGELYHGELYSRMGLQLISFYSPSGPATGYMDYGIAGSAVPAFSTAYGNAGTHTDSTGTYDCYHVRRKCRIFNNNIEIGSIYPGDIIAVPGNSEADSGTSWVQPYRLRIYKYRKGTTWYKPSNDLTCDTDIEIGYSMRTQITPYGSF